MTRKVPVLDVLRRHPVAADAALARALFVGSVGTVLAEPPPDQPVGVVVPLLAILDGTVAVRRLVPRPALVVATVLQMAVWAFVPHPRGLRSAGGAAGVLTAWTAVGVVTGVAPVYVLPIVALTGVGAVLAGDNVRTRRAYLVELEQRAERAEALRAAEAREAVAEERTRIARELHDVVAHSVSVMVVQAGAARHIAERDPVRAADALGTIEQVGRESLQELRRVLGVLRSGPDEVTGTAPQPDLGALDGLVAQCRDAGLRVDVIVDGPVRPVPAGVGLTAYRIVQESLTNVLKHAGPAAASVAVSYRPADLTVEVVDDGRGAASTTRPAGSTGSTGSTGSAGHGIVGMRERAATCGGSLVAGPRPGGGFRVRAVLPTGPIPSEIP
ncbi:MAG: sensor histidine kinase [Ilumatobacteraceae bacterium]|nr:sensor histidine kinase [Ilumatobacteraceae bacterium]